MSRFYKPSFPRIQQGEPLSRNLLFSIPAGWGRGVGGVNAVVTRADRSRQVGTGINNPPGSIVNCSGRALASGNNSWYEWAHVVTGLFEIGAPFSVAVMVQPTIIPGIGVINRRVFQKRLDGANTSPGFDMFLDTFIFSSWSFEWCDGVNEQTLRSTTAPALNRCDLLVGTLNVQENVARLYVNGVLENSTALTVNPVNNTLPYKVCGGIGPGGNQGGDNQVSMAAVWSRTLQQHDVERLHADPYTMWR